MQRTQRGIIRNGRSGVLHDRWRSVDAKAITARPCESAACGALSGVAPNRPAFGHAARLGSHRTGAALRARKGEPLALGASHQWLGLRLATVSSRAANKQASRPRKEQSALRKRERCTGPQAGAGAKPEPLPRLLVADTGSHACAAGTHTRASTKAGVGPLFMSDPLLAKLETAAVAPYVGNRAILPVRPRALGAVAFTGVSCSGAVFCVGVGAPSGSPTGAIGTWNGSEWVIAGPPAITVLPENTYAGVSCSSSQSCTALEVPAPAAGSTAPQPSQTVSVNRWNGVAWLAQTATVPSAVVPKAVACPSLDRCIALVDDDADSFRQAGALYLGF